LSKHAAGALGLEHIAPHDLRRTCAALCHATGVSLSRFNNDAPLFLAALENIEMSERLRVFDIAVVLGLVDAIVQESQIALDLAVEVGKDTLV
jgi:hypothetical protein